MGADYQNRKYNGKEFIEMHGLDEYDSEARWYYPAIMRTTTIDPLAEKYYSISPYAWCGNNPVRFIDPDGREIKKPQEKGNIQNKAWSKIPSVIPKKDFISYQETMDCYSAAEKQLTVVGFVKGDVAYQIYSDKFDEAKTKNGFAGVAPKAVVQRAIDYINFALEEGKPVFVGVTYNENWTNPKNFDKTSDHYVVIVGRGSDEKGNYFTFFENSFYDPQKGTSEKINRLYYDPKKNTLEDNRGSGYKLARIRTTEAIKRKEDE